MEKIKNLPGQAWRLFIDDRTTLLLAGGGLSSAGCYFASGDLVRGWLSVVLSGVALLFSWPRLGRRA